MSTVIIERGVKSYACWNYLRDNDIAYTSYHYYPQVELNSGPGFLAFQIEDSAVASYCALKFS